MEDERKEILKERELWKDEGIWVLRRPL